jgi:hypothetical protein
MTACARLSGVALLLAFNAMRLCAANAMNPDLSVNGLFLYAHDSSPTASSPGLGVQELEAMVASDIDPYLRGTIIIAMAPAGAGLWDIAPEEAYLESLSLPGLTLKGGLFKAALGRHNTLHTHAFPFIDAPLFNQAWLGDGVGGAGVSASLLAPAPWFMELTAQAFNLRDNPLFDSPLPDELAGLLSLKNLWDLDQDSTVELLGSWMEGRDAAQELTQLAVGALTYKWKGDGGRAFIVAGEYSRAMLPAARLAPLQDEAGASGWFQWEFSRRWWIQGRAEALGLTGDLSQPALRRYSALLGVFPTEFSGWRAQYDWAEGPVGSPEHRISLQANFTMGAHPAHAY